MRSGCNVCCKPPNEQMTGDSGFIVGSGRMSLHSGSQPCGAQPLTSGGFHLLNTPFFFQVSTLFQPPLHLCGSEAVNHSTLRRISYPNSFLRPTLSFRCHSVSLKVSRSLLSFTPHQRDSLRYNPSRQRPWLKNPSLFQSNSGLLH